MQSPATSMGVQLMGGCDSRSRFSARSRVASVRCDGCHRKTRSREYRTAPDYAASMAFSRCSHSSSSTISKRMTLLRIAGTNSAQSFFDACSEQMSNTDRL